MEDIVTKPNKLFKPPTVSAFDTNTCNTLVKVTFQEEIIEPHQLETIMPGLLQSAEISDVAPRGHNLPKSRGSTVLHVTVESRDRTNAETIVSDALQQIAAQ